MVNSSVERNLQQELKKVTVLHKAHNMWWEAFHIPNRRCHIMEKGYSIAGPAVHKESLHSTGTRNVPTGDKEHKLKANFSNHQVFK